MYIVIIIWTPASVPHPPTTSITPTNIMVIVVGKEHLKILGTAE